MRQTQWFLTGFLLVSVVGCSDSGNGAAEPKSDDAVQSTAGLDTTDKQRPASLNGASGDHDPNNGAHATKTHSNTNHGHVGHGGHAAVMRTGGLKIGEVVPDFEVTLDGKVCKLSELRADKALTADGTLALTFWCSFCHSCRDVEMDLNKLASELKGKAGVIAIDASVGETTEEIAAFKTSKGLSLPIAIDADASIADLFGIKVTTTTVVIDSAGKLRYCGQFADRDHKYAADALAAVMAGTEVVVPESAHRG